MKLSNINIPSLIHPIVAGALGFTATAIGAYFFKVQNPYLWIALGLALFLFTNQIMLKFQFNSYQFNGATITTIITFLSQTVCLTIWKRNQINCYWILGAILILVGSVLLKSQKQKQK